MPLEVSRPEVVSGAQVRDAFDTLDEFFEETPHSFDGGITLWHAGPVQRMYTMEELRTFAMERLAQVRDCERGMAGVRMRVNTVRTINGYPRLEASEDPFDEENIGILAMSMMEEQKEYEESLPFRLTEEQAEELALVLQRIGVLPIDYGFIRLEITVRKNVRRRNKYVGFRIQGIASPDTAVCPAVAQYYPIALFQEIAYGLHRDVGGPGREGGEPWDELEIDGRVWYPVETEIPGIPEGEKEQFSRELSAVSRELSECNAELMRKSGRDEENREYEFNMADLELIALVIRLMESVKIDTDE